MIIHVSRFTFHVSRFTFHVSRFTFHVSRLDNKTNGETRMTITTSELKKGLTILLDGEMYKITEWSHNKQGRGSANVRLQLKNVRTGANIERTFMAGSKFEDVRMERRPVQFMYADGDDYFFMDNETY